MDNIPCCEDNYGIKSKFDVSQYGANKWIKMNLLMITLAVVAIYGVIYTVLGYTGQLNDAFSNPLDGLYFSMTTLSSVGYGDVLPSTTLAKAVVMSQQAMVILLYTVLIF